MDLFTRLLLNADAVGMALARAENTKNDPKVFASLKLSCNDTNLYVLTTSKHSFAMPFAIDYSLLLKSGSSMAEVSDFVCGYKRVSVGVLSKKFRMHVLDMMIEAAQSEEIIVRSWKMQMFMPNAGCLDEVKIWLDLNEKHNEV